MKPDLIHPNKESEGELSQLIIGMYPKASEEVRIEILNRIDERYESDNQDKEEKEWSRRQRLALLRLLSDATPGSHETARRWAKAKEGIPDEQLPSGTPGERLEPKADWVVPISPYTKEQLLEADPVSVFADYADLPKEDFFNRKSDQNGLWNMVRDLASENVAFGVRFANALSDANDSSHQLWNSILQGWRNAPFSEADWPVVVTCMEENFDALSVNHIDTAEVLKAAVNSESRRIPYKILSRLESLAKKLWAHIEPLDDKRILSNVDWGMHAINSTAGVLTQFWLHVLSWRRKEESSNWDGLPLEYQTLFTGVVDGKSYGAKMGQVILTEQIEYVSYLDQKWAKERLPPLFDFGAGEERAIRVWSGFSTQGRLSPHVVDMLRPQLQALFNKLHNFSEDERRGLVERIAAVVHFEGDMWWDNGLLNKFITAANEDDLIEFTSTLTRFWESYDEDKTVEVWESWISLYIENRLAGKPKSFSPKETGALASWVFPFAFMADKFIATLTMLPVPELRHAFIFHRLQGNSLPEEFPEPTLQLVSWLLKGAVRNEFWEGDDLIKIIERLIKSGIEKEALRSLIGGRCAELGLDNICDLISGN